MIDPAVFCRMMSDVGVGFYTGVPDSLLRHFCSYIRENIPPERNVTAVNEGCAVGLAAGYHMATGKVPLVYMQNSGLGNATNPLLSLADPEVYRIPMVLLIGWRGEPGVHDEPQHVKQGRITCPLLDTMEVPYSVIGGDPDGCAEAVERCRRHLAEHGSPYAFVVRRDSFSEYAPEPSAADGYAMTREDALNVIVPASGDSVLVSTTGLTSRELYEIRDARGEGHGRDFLTVGSMGHSSQIALGMALALPGRRIVCIDGDGAVLMHMGGMATLAVRHPPNLVHIVINNGVHDSVGGQPTV